MSGPKNSQASMAELQAGLLQAAYGAQTAQLLYVAATLGVDDSALQRIIRGLVGLGVCAESADGRFSLTSTGAYLRSDHPDSVQPRLLLNGEIHYALWTEVLTTVRTGEAASQRLFGMPFYDY